MLMVQPAICVLVSPPDHLDAHSSLRTTGIGSFVKLREKFSNSQQGASPAYSLSKFTEHKPVQISLIMSAEGPILMSQQQESESESESH